MAKGSASERLARWLVFTVPALWTVNYVVARKAPGVIEPYTLAFGRWAIAGLLLGWWTRAELWQHRHYLRRHWGQYVLLGTLGMLVCGAWVYLAGHTTTAVNIALIYSAAPVLIMLVSALWLHEHLRASQLLGVALAVLGVVHVVLKGQWGALANLRFTAGDLWIVAATLAWTLYSVLQRVWPAPLSASARLAAICAGGVLVLAPCAAWEVLTPGGPPWSVQAAVLVVVAALVPGIGAYWAYGYAQQILGASRVAVSLYLGPIYGALVAWAWLGEQLLPVHAVGAALILPGILLASRK